MRWVLMTAFGVPTEPEVNRNLAMVSGPTPAKAAMTAASSARASTCAMGSTPGCGWLRLPPTTTPSCRSATASIAGRKRSSGSAKTTPGRSSSKLPRSLPKSFDISELPGEIGATGTPTCIAASASRACSMPLSERITTGRSAESFWPSSQEAIATTRRRASP